jgi:hypothetical protein
MHHEVVRRARWFTSAALFGAACLLMASTSPQCARTTDNTLGLSAAGRERHAEGCRESCLDTAKQARVNERERFLAAIKACEDSTCRENEAEFHESIMEQIAVDQQACFGGCHNQGGGQGGD